MKQRLEPIPWVKTVREVSEIAEAGKKPNEKIANISMVCAGATYISAIVIYEQDRGAE